ncbi:DUF4157 domain-containing protein [Aquabacterium sp.]|uniref:eCIS core domain-containing protein n=1 Tax=Aquabacterium sp. TaxID=1872578 RepID=UPI003D6D3A84
MSALMLKKPLRQNSQDQRWSPSPKPSQGLPPGWLQRSTSSSCACGGSCPRCQAKSTLQVGAANDHHEQEADRMADAVMGGGPAQALQPGATGAATKLARKVLEPFEVPDSATSFDTEQATPSPEEAPETLQRSALGEGGAVTSGYEQSLQRAVQGGGDRLPADTRAFMESRFGQDFSGVKVHSDGEAGSLASQVNARAFTVGNDIFFGQSQYAPGSQSGQHLLAHELTHVVQQSSGRLSRQIMRAPLFAGVTPCSSYPGYNTSVDRKTYNCAGLALRTYLYTSPASAVYADIRKNFYNPVCPVGNCKGGQVKFWLWEYDIQIEDSKGTVVKPKWRDFHIVAGRMDAGGVDPTDVYSKNGPRPIHGPGPGPSFKPAAKDQALDADDKPGTMPDGSPVYKVRSNMSEVVTCADCF